MIEVEVRVFLGSITIIIINLIGAWAFELINGTFGTIAKQFFTLGFLANFVVI